MNKEALGWCACVPKTVKLDGARCSKCQRQVTLYLREQIISGNSVAHLRVEALTPGAMPHCVVLAGPMRPALPAERLNA